MTAPSRPQVELAALLDPVARLEQQLMQDYLADLLLDVPDYCGTLPQIPAHLPAQPVMSAMDTASLLQANFQALLVEVGSMTLAIPFGKLEKVLRFEGVATLGARAGFYCGALYSRHATIRVLDIRRLLNLPLRQAAEAGYQHVLVSQNRDHAGHAWGLAVDHISDSVCIEPSEVRLVHSQHPWIAGYYTRKPCVILDLDAIDKILTPSNQTSLETV